MIPTHRGGFKLGMEMVITMEKEDYLHFKMSSDHCSTITPTNGPSSPGVPTLIKVYATFLEEAP